ncbi:polysaccharide deacetylase, partial [Mesorhizobium sp. M7A.F.Ca.CA.001.09.2.1]
MRLLQKNLWMIAMSLAMASAGHAAPLACGLMCSVGSTSGAGRVA